MPKGVKRLYGLVFACYGKDTESKQPNPIVVNFDNDEKAETREMTMQEQKKVNAYKKKKALFFYRA